MKQTIQLLGFLLLIGWVVPLKGQDPHFSQYMNMSVGTNPAHIGHFEGKLRLNGAFRRQWASVADAFQTTSASLDFPKGNIGLGLEILDDQAGLAGLRHTNGLFGLAYHRPMGRHHLSIGVKAGFIQKGLDPTQLSFDSQYISSTGFDPSLPSLENLPVMRVTAGDLHSGFAWSYFNEEAGLLRGAFLNGAIAHANQPNIALLSTEKQILPMKTSLNLGLSIVGTDRLSILPSLLYMRQGTARELTASLTAHYMIDQQATGQVGIGMRRGDAIIPYVGLAYDGFQVGLSYDITTSLLGGFTNMQGGPELTISYIWDGETAPRPRNTGQSKPLRILNDQDGDGILDQADDCPELPGLIAFKGCPDSDNDGLPDQVDKCPNEAGPRIRSGCPSSDIDADGDGIPDKIDMCPQIIGIPEFQGCPDTDQDGIPDFEDLCPTVKGEKNYKGCPQAQQPMHMPYQWQQPTQQAPQPTYYPPASAQGGDADRDGTPDYLDKCPMVAGSQQLQGCPDSDQDGISDFEDRCPFTAGRRESQGCPDNQNNWDADGDGIMNQVDQCPYVAGLPAYNGCPDTDKDGFSDLEDACPLIYGPQENRGCPIQGAMPASPPMSETANLPTQAQFGPVHFDSNKAIIKQEYFDMLNRLAVYLQANPMLHLQLQGHTDFEGDAMYNMVLGQNRARAISYYLEARGVDIKRISMLSYGENLPVDNNQTEQGKANNRRVELNLVKN